MTPNKYKSRLYRKNNNTAHGSEKGWDYTPLFKYLLNKVGSNWNDLYREVKPRLNTFVPIYWVVNRTRVRSEMKEYVRVGESSYYSCLYVDDKGLLQIVNKEINHTTLEPSCDCCTHTFNGKVFTKKYKEKHQIIIEDMIEINNKV